MVKTKAFREMRSSRSIQIQGDYRLLLPNNIPCKQLLTSVRSWVLLV